MEINRKLLNVLLDLHAKKRSGILRVHKEAAKKQFVLQDGLLAFAESNLPQEHLANVMVSLNLIPRVHLGQIAESMKGGKTSEEAILALPDTGHEKVEKGRREQAITIGASLLAWGSCDLRLYPQSESVRCRVILAMELPDLIIASVRRAVSKRLLSSPQRFFERTLVFAGEAQFPLNGEEDRACSLLKTARTAAELLTQVSDQTLLCLYHVGLIKLIEERDSADLDAPAAKLDELLVRFETATLYEVLGVNAQASQEEIQAVYHEQAKQLHPDRFQTGEFSSETRARAEQVFARINEAYQTLKDPQSREAYDSLSPQKKSAASAAKGSAQSAETAEGLYREGRSLLAKGDVETAVERLRGCVWLCPEKAIYHHHLGVAEARIPKFRKSAEQHLLKAIELQDLSADSHLALAKLYIDVKLPRKAEQQLEQALRWDPENPEARKLVADLTKL